MIRLRFLITALGIACLLAGCGKPDSDKNDQLYPAKKNPDEQPKKDGDKKHTHEPG